VRSVQFTGLPAGQRLVGIHGGRQLGLGAAPAEAESVHPAGATGFHETNPDRPHLRFAFSIWSFPFSTLEIK
jgi:hypothetical protein